MARGELLAVHQVADHNHGPRKNHEHRSHGGDQVERTRDRVARVEQHNRGQQHHGGKEQRVTRHAVLGNLAQELRCTALACQAECHTRGGEDTGVRRGGCAGNHHEVDDVRGDAQARQSEHGDEGTLIGADQAPGGDHQDDGERAHVEDHNTYRHGVNCLGQGLFGVLGFCGGGTDELGAHEREDGNLECTEEANQVVGEHSAVVPEVCDRCLRTTGRGEADGDHAATNDNQGDDGDNLNHGEPEFDFAEVLHGDQVQGQQNADDGERRDPWLQVGPPHVQVADDCDDVRDGGNHPHEPVGPAEEEARHGADKVGGEVREGLVPQVGEQNLAHSSQHQEDDGADEHVHENN